MSSQESDRSIVVRDGRADHMAKGSTGRQSDQSTCAEGKKVPRRSVSSSLIALREKASHEPDYRFRGLSTDLYTARRREEPGAGKPHAGICEGGRRVTGGSYLDQSPSKVQMVSFYKTTSYGY
jgi:hypothetical protein